MCVALRPKHFTDLLTLNEAGLQARFDVNEDDRDSELFGSIDVPRRGRKPIEQRLAGYAKRGPCIVELNPVAFPPEELKALMTQLQLEHYGPPQRADSGLVSAEPISLAYPFHGGQVAAPWSAELGTQGHDGPTFVQGQRLLLVATHRGQPCGFAVMEFRCSQEEDSTELLVAFDLDLVYVPPKLRGKGFGLDLSIAAGLLAERFFLAVWRACKKGITLIPVVNADLESAGGEAFVRQVYEKLVVARDVVCDYASDEFPEGVECLEVVAEFGY